MKQGALQTGSQPRPPGRPREFDIDDALDKAIRVFRERGYHATSITDLSEAMELTPGSIYKAFKDKHAVFLAAFDRYAARRAEQTRKAATSAKSARNRIRDALLSYIEMSQGIEGWRGCLVVGGNVELSAQDPDVAARVSAAMKKNEALFAELIRSGHADGSIPACVDPDDTARVLVCLTQGLRVVGKTRARLDARKLADIAMKMLA